VKKVEGCMLFYVSKGSTVANTGATVEGDFLFFYCGTFLLKLNLILGIVKKFFSYSQVRKCCG